MSDVTESRFLRPFTPPAAGPGLAVVSGTGATVTDAHGRTYVDGMAALWFANLGYGRPEVVQAIAEQAGQLHAYHCFDPFTNEPAEALAAAIADRSPVDDPRVFFTNSGSEAVDTAIKLVRATHQWTGDHDRQIIISRSSGYHGTNLGGTSAQGIPANQQGWGELAANFEVVPGDDVEALSVAFAEHGERIAGVIAEPVQGAGGVIPPPEGWWATARRLCDDHGALLVADEVICGFGRLGHWFGSEFYGVRPDAMTFAKAVTSGYVPLGGVVVGARMRAALESDPSTMLRHGYTYSGHALACAAGLACLQVTENEGLLARASELGQRLRGGLEALVADGRYAGTRGEGFVFALQTHEGQVPADVRNRALGHDVIVRPLADAVAICPPLVITDAQLDQVVDALAAAA